MRLGVIILSLYEILTLLVNYALRIASSYINSHGLINDQ